MMLFLHEQGYNFFNVGRLTYIEINSLIGAKNRRVKKEESMAKKARQKAKRGRRR